MVQVTDALLEIGLRDDQVARVMGGNALRVLADGLPAG
jgi:microsomal dipeptidase-like Zn-dependent dipeptidase